MRGSHINLIVFLCFFAHAAVIMILTWIGAASIGLFMPRFMKKAWAAPRWFQVSLTVVSVIKTCVKAKEGKQLLGASS